MIYIHILLYIQRMKCETVSYYIMPMFMLPIFINNLSPIFSITCFLLQCYLYAIYQYGWCRSLNLREFWPSGLFYCLVSSDCLNTTYHSLTLHVSNEVCDNQMWLQSEHENCRIFPPNTWCFLTIWLLLAFEILDASSHYIVTDPHTRTRRKETT